MEKRFLNVEEFQLPLPEGYEDTICNADSLFAELLIKYYYAQKKYLIIANDSCIDKLSEERNKNE